MGRTIDLLLDLDSVEQILGVNEHGVEETVGHIQTRAHHNSQALDTHFVHRLLSSDMIIR